MEQLTVAAMMLRIYLPEVEKINDRALSGDRRAGLRMLAMAGGLIRAGYPMPPKLQDWIANGLNRLSQGHAAEQAFQFIGKKRGERAGFTNVLVDNDQFVRAMLAELAHQGRGLTMEQAFCQVAEIDSCSEDTVKAAWTARHVQAKQILALNQEWIELVQMAI